MLLTLLIIICVFGSYSSQVNDTLLSKIYPKSTSAFRSIKKEEMKEVLELEKLLESIDCMVNSFNLLFPTEQFTFSFEMNENGKDKTFINQFKELKNTIAKKQMLEEIGEYVKNMINKFTNQSSSEQFISELYSSLFHSPLYVNEKLSKQDFMRLYSDKIMQELRNIKTVVVDSFDYETFELPSSTLESFQSFKAEIEPLLTTFTKLNKKLEESVKIQEKYTTNIMEIVNSTLNAIQPSIMTNKTIFKKIEEIRLKIQNFTEEFIPIIKESLYSLASLTNQKLQKEIKKEQSELNESIQQLKKESLELYDLFKQFYTEIATPVKEIVHFIREILTFEVQLSYEMIKYMMGMNVHELHHQHQHHNKHENEDN